MKIVYVIDCIDGIHGGTERQLYNLITGMLSRGHFVSLYVLRHTEFSKTLSQFPCPVKCLEVKSIRSFQGFVNLWKFRRYLIEDRVDVLHGFFNDIAIIVPPLMCGTGIRTWTSRRDMGIWYSRTNLKLLRLYRFAKTKIICNCNAVAMFTRLSEKLPDNLVEVIYNGLEPLETNKPRAHSSDPICSRVPGVIKVVLVANVREVKRIEDLVLAAKYIRSKSPHHKFYVIGSFQDQNYYEKLQEVVGLSGLAADFEFFGVHPDPRSLLEYFDIGVLTSESEGLSNTIMEYLGAGLPVVASNVGGNPELVVHGYNGFLYQMGDTEGLANAILALTADSGLRTKLSANAKKSMQELHCDQMVALHEQEYQRGLDIKSPTSGV